MWLFETYSDENDVQTVKNVVERDTWWLNGDEVDEFENSIADYTNRDYAVSFNSGTNALFTLLKSIDVENEEVIVPSFTYPATVNAVINAGGIPVYSDIEKETLGLDANDVKNKITDDTACIIPVHFGGNVSKDIKQLIEIANNNHLYILEDSAHSLGAKLNDKPAGSFGDAAMFSFSFNKLISTGAGGIMVTDSKHLYEESYSISKQGKHPEYNEFIRSGFNFSMPSMNAALGVSQFNKIDYIIERRREMANYLTDKLSNYVNVLTPPSNQNGVYQTYNILCKNYKERDELKTYLSNNNIPTRVTYKPVHKMPYHSKYYKNDNLKVTEDISSRILTLPFHLNLTKNDLDYISNSILKYFSY